MLNCWCITWPVGFKMLKSGSYSCARHEGFWRIRRIAPIIPKLCTAWRWMVSFKSRSLYPQGKATLLTHWVGGYVDPRAGISDLESREVSCSCRGLDPDTRAVQAKPSFWYHCCCCIEEARNARKVHIPIIYLWFLLMIGTVIWSSMVECGRCIIYFRCKKKKLHTWEPSAFHQTYHSLTQKWSEYFLFKLGRHILYCLLRRCPAKIIIYINFFILFYFVSCRQ
jgi:hypothetical protein